MMYIDYKQEFHVLLFFFIALAIVVFIWFIKWVARNAVLAEQARELELTGLKNKHNYEMNMMAAQWEIKMYHYSHEQALRAGYYEGKATGLHLLMNGELAKMANSHKGYLKSNDKFEIVDGVDQMKKEQLEGQIEIERQKAKRWEKIANNYRAEGLPQLRKPIKDLRNRNEVLTFISNKFNVTETEPGKYSVTDKGGFPIGNFHRELLIEGKPVQVLPGIKMVKCAMPGCNNVKHTSQQTSYCSPECRDKHKSILKYA